MLAFLTASLSRFSLFTVVTPFIYVSIPVLDYIRLGFFSYANLRLILSMSLKNLLHRMHSALIELAFLLARQRLTKRCFAAIDIF